MQFFMMLFVVAATTSNPVSKVLQLISELQQKVLKEGEAEQKQYEAFAEWCEDSAVAKQYEIKDGKSAVERLSATIEKESANIVNAESKIGELVSTITVNQADLKAATEIRTKEAKDFAAADADLAETISMLSRAISIISRNMNGSFLQGPAAEQLKDALSTIANAAMIQTGDRSKLQALLQASADQKDGADEFDLQPTGAPDPKAYESQSGGIVDTLEDMNDKAKEMKNEAVKAEMNSKHNFEMLAQSLNDAVKNDGKILAETKANKATSEEAKAIAEGDLSAATKELSNDKKDLSDLSTDCQQRAQDWTESQASRSEELQALVDAKKIISEMTGGAADKAYGLLQQDAESDSTQDAKDALVQKITQLGRKHGDVVLSQLAMRVEAAFSSSADPFGKVKGLIQDMLEKLVADAAAEASHKAFCDKEMSESEAKIEDHSSTIEKFSARKDKAVATIGKLTEEVATLQKELHAIAQQQAKMTEMRATEKASFAEAKKDYEDGIQGLTMALQILRDYYAEKDSFIQQPAVATHSKAGGAATGIIGILEVAQSDFSKLLADAQVAEDSAQREYDKITQENQVSTAMKTTSSEAKTKNKGELKQYVAEVTSDIEGEQTELDAVTEYYDKLKPACIAKPEPYAERKRRREAEIAGLKEAMSILDGLTSGGDSFLAVRTVRRHA